MKNIEILALIIYLVLFTMSFSCNGRHADSPSEKKSTNDTVVQVNVRKDSLQETNLINIIDTFDTGEPMKIHYFNSMNPDSVYEKQYYRSGNLFIEGALLNYTREGKWVAYYESGKIWSVGFFKNDLKHGSSNVYYENGQIRYTKNYQNDIAEGQWSFYDDKGNLLGEVMYENGKILWQKGSTDE